MKYGLVGERLGHSFSKSVHNMLADYDYSLCEVAKENFESFAKERGFSGINVTIPYKEAIIPHLFFIDSAAKEIGAVNTVVNKDGRLYGYNTDFTGMDMLLSRLGISLDGKKVVILGSGGTSKTAYALAKKRGAREILKVSRTAKDGSITYDCLYERHSDAEVIINTTPVGMYPDIFDCPIDISGFKKLIGVIDAVYNPLRTPLVLDALDRGLAAEGGLYMLVRQAVGASEIFLDKKYPKEILENIFKKILKDKENIVLIGMPASGKSTVGKILAKKTGRELIDTDALIVNRAGKEIKDIFASEGERAFRDLESEVIKEVGAKGSAIIATGGGAILRKENVRALRQNGTLFFIDRPLEYLVPTKSRPLSSDRASIEKRYSERYQIYMDSCDVRISAEVSAEEVAEKIMENFLV